MSTHVELSAKEFADDLPGHRADEPAQGDAAERLRHARATSDSNLAHFERMPTRAGIPDRAAARPSNKMMTTDLRPATLPDRRAPQANRSITLIHDNPLTQLKYQRQCAASMPYSGAAVVSHTRRA